MSTIMYFTGFTQILLSAEPTVDHAQGLKARLIEIPVT